MGFPSFKDHYASILAVLAGVIFSGQGQSPNRRTNARHANATNAFIQRMTNGDLNSRPFRDTLEFFVGFLAENARIGVP
jgi:hypothetical protein